MLCYNLSEWSQSVDVIGCLWEKKEEIEERERKSSSTHATISECLHQVMKKKVRGS